MYLMLQRDQPEDFVVATGESSSLQELTATAFDAVGLNWREWVITDTSLHRPSEILGNRGNASKAATHLGWQPRFRMREVVKAMVRARLEARAVD